MKLQKIKFVCMAFVLMLSACATVTPNQAINAIKTKYPEALFIYVDAANNEISNALVAAHLKVSSSTTSDAMAKVLLSSSKTPVAVAGKSDMVTAATIRRAIEDAGAALPKNGKLVIVGNASDFVDTVTFATGKGLTVDVISPVEKSPGVAAGSESVEVAPSTNPAMKLQDQVQKSSNAQVNQLLQDTGRRK